VVEGTLRDRGSRDAKKMAAVGTAARIAVFNRWRILDAADEVFGRLGIQAPLELVMDAAGVGRTTFYRHFSDREAVLSALLAMAIDELEAEVARYADRED
jgi:AcrR family transcriptional regulator